MRKSIVCFTFVFFASSIIFAQEEKSDISRVIEKNGDQIVATMNQDLAQMVVHNDRLSSNYRSHTVVIESMEQPYTQVFTETSQSRGTKEQTLAMKDDARAAKTLALAHSHSSR